MSAFLRSCLKRPVLRVDSTFVCVYLSVKGHFLDHCLLGLGIAEYWDPNRGRGEVGLDKLRL